jgi:Chloroplast import apparatus Tic20-like/EF-hand domain pair
VYHSHINNNKAFRLQATATEEQVTQLKNMAAKLRAEAAALEAERQQSMVQAAERTFNKFDTNQDDQVDLQELRQQLEKMFKLEISDDRLEKLMSTFDKNGDGVLQVEEFVSLDQFRNQMDAITRDEKQQARDTQKAVQAEQEAAAVMQAQMALINDREPSVTDKLVSVLPYLYPLLEGLQFARFLVTDHPENPVAMTAALIYGLYRSIPYGGFLALYALSRLSDNPAINRLVRFNMQQAVYLDIALIIPGLVFGLVSLIGGGDAIPPELAPLVSDGVLVALLATLGYTTVSSLLGNEPNKIPFISDAVNKRMPTIDMLMDAQKKGNDTDNSNKKD